MNIIFKKKQDIILNKPFFKLPRGQKRCAKNGKTILARCHSCKTLFRGNKKNLFPFIKHIQTAHPEKFKLFEQCRTHEIQKNQPVEIVPNTQEEDVLEIHDEPVFTPYTLSEQPIKTQETATDREETSSTTSETSVSEVLLQLLTNLVDEKLMNRRDSTDIIKQVTDLQNEVKGLREAVKRCNGCRRQLQSELYSLEREIQQNNLLFRYIPFEATWQNAETVIQQFLSQNFNIHHVPIEKVIVVNSFGKTANMLVTFREHAYANFILNSKHKIRFTNVYIERGITKNGIQRKNKLLLLRREILKRNPEVQVSVIGTQLIANGMRFEWSHNDGLVILGDTEGTENALLYLKGATKLDLEDFVKGLKTT